VVVIVRAGPGGVSAACRYELGINHTYQEMAAHYRAAIAPTRVRRPRDKAKVEIAVQVVERWVLVRLRHRRFFSLGELNAAIRERNDELNERIMRRIGCSRRALLEAIEQSAMLSLEIVPFEYAEWKRCRPDLDYHIGKRASLTTRWRFSIAAPASPCMSAIRHRIGTRQLHSICRVHTGAMPIGRRPSCDARQGELVPQPPTWLN
jgi:hypothetical protein